MDTKKIAIEIRNLLFKMAVKDRLLIKERDLPLSRIEKIVKLALKASEPTQLQKAVESAGFYLSNSEVEIEEQVSLIVAEAEKNEQGHTLIDEIEGVCVWEPLEGRYTPSEFLDLIGY
jgi:hypothetical protein